MIKTSQSTQTLSISLTETIVLIEIKL